MAQIKRLARGFIGEVETAVPATFVVIGGLRNIGMTRSKNDADMSDFNSGGNDEHLVASRGESMTIGAIFMEDNVTPFSRDPGQKRLEDLAALIGDASVGGFRVTTPSGKKRTIKCTVNVGGPGGGNNDPADWTAELTRTGAPTDWV